MAVNKLSQLKKWLLERRFFSASWFAKDAQAKVAEEVLAQLPKETLDALLSAVNDLPTPPCEQEAVRAAVSDAIARWRKSPGRSTASIVVLVRPVSSVARILSDGLTNKSGALAETLQDQSLKVSLLDWVERPADVQDIKEKIQRKLGWQEEDFPAEEELGYKSRAEKDRSSAGAEDSRAENNDDANALVNEQPSAAQSLTLAVIPNLGWCFLRSADGLDGIDYLQELLLDDRRQFWVIGSGEVGWEYLHSTLKIGAYCGETMRMPKLSGKELQSWLAPIIDQFNIQFTNRALHHRLKESGSLLQQDLSFETLDQLRENVSREVSTTLQSSVDAIKEDLLGKDEQATEDSPERDYFNRLAHLAEGVSIVALQLFIQSLRDRQDSDELPPQLITTAPKLPLLPDLDQGDLYLLYSLMLHGDLTVKALAKSLGDSPQIVNNQVQVLRSSQVIEQKDGVVKINPVHYPNLRRELARNNFIIEMD